ncbi:MAG: hypothetical protein IPN91_16165 [Holophagaceae bacterium]|uniref:Uncharacterized protein n=1 Tax=Candidatus Geothrix odensensis TaxID=2954440 RepID=A0A936F6T8_9BACT|nr:hypothetical protein [Candidatus Geothrix odensensis]
MGSGLAQLQRGHALIPDPRWRELVLAHTPQPELKRLARALSAAFQAQGWDCPVPLQSLASDEATALAAVLVSLDHATSSSPEELRRIVGQALQLKPAPREEARLHEHLADAWAAGVRLPDEAAERSPIEEALLSLGQALGALAHGLNHEESRLAAARLFLRGPPLLLRLRRPAEAQEALQFAAERLADHPLHPEQPRLRLALGQLHLLQGHLTKGIRALEEGLHPQGGFKPLPQDQAALMLALRQALAGQSQFLRAATMLQSAQRMLEHAQDFRSLVSVQIALAQVRLAQASPRPASTSCGRPPQTARMQGDTTLQARVTWPWAWSGIQQFPGPAPIPPRPGPGSRPAPGDRRSSRSSRSGGAGPSPPWATPWAPTRAQFQALAPAAPPLPEEQGTTSSSRARWPGSAAPGGHGPSLPRHVQHYESTGLLWRQRPAQLLHSQAMARESPASRGWRPRAGLGDPGEPEGARRRLGVPVAGPGVAPRPRPAALDRPGHGGRGAGVARGLERVQAAARDLQFPGADPRRPAPRAPSCCCSGARSWGPGPHAGRLPQLPAALGQAPRGAGVQLPGPARTCTRFRQTVEGVGLRFIQPERADPLVDWTPTQMNLPAFPDPG